MLIRVTISIMLLLLVYLTGVRFVSQLIVSTDKSTLFDTVLANITATPQSFDLSRPLVGDNLNLNNLKPNTAFYPLKTLAALDFVNADNYYLLAQSYLAAGEVTLASRMCMRSLRLAAVDPKTWLLIGWISGLEGRLERGYASLDRAIMLDATRMDSLAQHGLYLYQVWLNTKSDRKPLYSTLALFGLNAALELNPLLYQDPEVNTSVASLYHSLGQPGYSVGILTRIPKDTVFSWPMLVQRAALLFDLSESVKAISLWKNKFNPKELSEAQFTGIEREIKRYSAPELSYFLAQICIAQGKRDEALKELTELVSKKGNSAEYRVALAAEYEHAGNAKEALRLYEEVLKLSPSNQEAKRKVMELYRKKRIS